MSDVFTPTEVADRWGVPRTRVEAMCRDGRLTAFKVGRSFRIHLAAVQAYEARPAVAPAAEPFALRVIPGIEQPRRGPRRKHKTSA